jgi:transposase
LYVLSTGCRWEDMPHDIRASPKTCDRRLLEYQRRRVWQRLVADLKRVCKLHTIGNEGIG